MERPPHLSTFQDSPDDPQQPMVEIAGLELSLVGGGGQVNILRGIDLTVAAGETLSIVGTSGAGKTTLLMAVSGLERPTAGSILVAGTDLGALDEDQLARFRRRHVGIVFQSFHLVPTMTALENAALPLEFAGDSDAADKAAEALSSVGLGERLRHYPGELSGGEQQRVALARAVVARPSLLLADEPTGNLDRETGERVMELLFALQAEQGATLILVTHDDALAGRCRRRLRMADGRIFAADGETP
jgi:putative ABC transport system ATP-binding protein